LVGATNNQTDCAAVDLGENWANVGLLDCWSGLSVPVSLSRQGESEGAETEKKTNNHLLFSLSLSAARDLTVGRATNKRPTTTNKANNHGSSPVAL
jgi:hypothetical protein